MALLEYDIDGIHKTFGLTKKCVTIGRGADADIQFKTDAEMSRRHCSILVQEDDACLLRDDGSTNGTHLNDQLIDAAAAVPLKDGDEIQVGKSFLTFHK